MGDSRKLSIGPLQGAICAQLLARMEVLGRSRRSLSTETGITLTRLAATLRCDRIMSVDEMGLICKALGLRASTVVAEAEAAIAAAHTPAPAPAPEPEPVEPEFIITSVADLPEDDYDYAPGELEALAAREGHAPAPAMGPSGLPFEERVSHIDIPEHLLAAKGYAPGENPDYFDYDNIP